MKRICLYSFAACLGLSLMACDGYKEPNPPAQSNPQLPILQLSDVTVENQLASSQYNLPQLVEEQANIYLAKVTCSVLGGNYNFNALAFISNNNFGDAYQVPVSFEKEDAEDVWNLYISPSDLSNVYHENISWSNDEATFQLRFNLVTEFTSNFGTQTAYVGGADNIYGPYNVTILPLEAELHYYYLYTPGASNGWNQEASQWLYSENDQKFNGYAVLMEEFKFTNQPDWNGLNYGAGENQQADDATGVYSGNLSTEGGNIKVGAEGLYYLDVTLNPVAAEEDAEVTSDGTFKATFIHTIGIIGSATPNDWNGSTPLTSEDYLIWTGEVNLIPGEYKFRANDGWDINLGGDPSSLTQDGDNIQFHGNEGTYTVTLDLKNIPYSCTIVKK